jgi:hypothetical protein
VPGWTGCDVCVTRVEPSDKANSVDISVRLTVDPPASERSLAELMTKPDVQGSVLLGGDDNVVCIVLGFGVETIRDYLRNQLTD